MARQHDNQVHLCRRCDEQTSERNALCCRCKVDSFPDDTYLRRQLSGPFAIRARPKNGPAIWEDRCAGRDLSGDWPLVDQGEALRLAMERRELAMVGQCD